MIKNKSKLKLLSEQASNDGFGSLIAVYNDIEEKWYYYVGEFKPSNPSSYIYRNYIVGRCVNIILDNEFTYFSGDKAKSELIRSEFDKIPEEKIEFDFRFIWFRV